MIGGTCPRDTTRSPARQVQTISGEWSSSAAGTRASPWRFGWAARLRERRDLEAEVLLIEPNPCQQALSELDLVAVGPERPEFCELWLPAVLKDLPVRTCFNRVEMIDPARRL